jgi:hypothetical protein
MIPKTILSRAQATPSSSLPGPTQLAVCLTASGTLASATLTPAAVNRRMFQHKKKQTISFYTARKLLLAGNAQVRMQTGSPTMPSRLEATTRAWFKNWPMGLPGSLPPMGDFFDCCCQLPTRIISHLGNLNGSSPRNGVS